MESYSIKGLNFSYPEQERLVLNNINLDIKSGEFVVLCGPSGCGKTTLLRQLKTVLAPHGVKVGEIYFEGTLLDELNTREQSSRIGFVMQSPDNQIVTDKVWHELAFGLESLGYDTPTIRLRVSEMASFFGIQNWFYKNVNELSGGQKQLLNLAGIMAMQPSVLILDEPTSQLDPIAASEFLATVGKINRELGTTIILTEHRLEEAMPLADRVIVMDNGKVIADGDPKEVGQKIQKDNHRMFLAMPVPMRIYAAVENELECPITVREGRVWLDTLINNGLEISDIDRKNNNKNSDTNEVVLELKDAWFKYEKDLPDVVKGVSIKVRKGEFLSILGGNGTGKSTTLSLLSGVNRPYRGNVYVKGKNLYEISDGEKFNGLLGVLPQNPQALFVKNTVKEDLYEILKGKSISQREKDLKVRRVSYLCDLNDLLERHPYDLSGGEQQRAALAKVLLLEPEILLLDEPTKGLDAEFKQQFAAIIKNLIIDGVTVVMVSHDIEFCAKYASRCALFFDGNVVTEGSPREFFSGNSFYTTSANRMARHRIKDAITVDDVILACNEKVSEEPKIDLDNELFEVALQEEKKKDKKVQYKKKIFAPISFFILLGLSIKGFPIISRFAWAGLTGDLESIKFDTAREQWKYVGMMLAFVSSAIVFFLSVFQKGEKAPISMIQVEKDKRKLSKRTITATILILLCIPLTIFVGVFYLGDRKYYFISLLIILEVMLPFVMIFEGRNPQARELVIISVLCAIGVAGRAAFFMIPQFKPVAAVVIVSAVAFGAESGFLVGAVTMFLSNVLYSQGPWTPWQMFAMGIIGFLAGILFRKGLLRRDRLSLSIFGGVVVFFIYGGIMNPASVLMFQSKINWNMIVTSWVTGVPFDLIHSAATVFFLMIMGEPMLEKLDRIKVKYGLVED
ncbi:energy-coupling factor transporter ATPase [Clostridium sporogenes]|uniref:energy-coupling factor transporter ATPase n=1 Tax=Clostridium sporogenes TaxID=1509 RepID=UPI00313C1CC1